MKIDGGCHCGNITYEAEVDPDTATVCHCSDCQTFSGSAFRMVVRVPEENVNFLSGTPKTYVKTAESGAKRVQAFCPDCGTSLYSTSVGEGPKLYGLRTGTARQRNELTPKMQIWRRSAQKWISDMESIPSVDTQP